MKRILRECLQQMRVEPFGMAMPGARLPRRIRRIAAGETRARYSRVRAACVATVCAALCAALAGVALTRAQSSSMADWEKAAGGKMTFEVASVKLDKDGRQYSNFPLGPGDSYSANGGLLSSAAMPLSSYIGFAYRLTLYQARALNEQLPKWATEQRFDVEARGAENSTKDQMRLMMQSLLADRFKLAAHIETRQGPVFALELAKSGQAGPELHLRSPDAKPCGKFTLSASARTADGSPDACDVFLTLVDIGHVHTSARNVTIGMIAGAMPFPGMEPLNRPVVDRTGLTGNFDFSIDYAPEDTASPSAPSSESQPTFLQALQSQLGLRLTSTTGPVTTLVIDHIEEPTPN